MHSTNKNLMFYKFSKIFKFFFIFILITGWIFSGWPWIWNFPPEIETANADTETLRPNAAGTYQAWGTFGSGSAHYDRTSDQSDSTGVQSPNGDNTSKETENLINSAQTEGTINSVTAYMTAKATTANPTTVFSDGFESAGAAWDDQWDGNGATTWTQGTAGSGEAAHSPHTGTYDAWAAASATRTITSDDLDLSGATSASLDFWYYLDDNEATDLRLYLYDGTTYDTIAQIGGGTESTWLQYSIPALDSQYFISNFRIRFTAVEGNGENSFVDDVTVTKTVPEQAKIIWKLGSTEVPDDAQTISTSAFTNYSDVRTTDPDGGAWSWDDVNSLEIGSIASGLETSEYIQVSEYWIVVDYAPIVFSITISDQGITFGNVAWSNQQDTITLGDTQTVQNTGSVATLEIKTTNATGGTGWTLASSIGVLDQFVFEFSTTTVPTWVKFDTPDSYKTATTSVASGATQNFDFRITAPSQTTDFEPKSITITIHAFAG